MDAINYVLFKNPVVTYSVGTVKHLGPFIIHPQLMAHFHLLGVTLAGIVSLVTKSDTSVATKYNPVLDERSIANVLKMNRNFLRLAGIFGASAVVIGAYGAHTLLSQEGNEHRKKVFQTASQYHFYHLLALLSAPFCKYPKVTALTVAGGIIIFCGSCYYQSLTGDEKYRKITPYGGSLLIIGWLTMLL